MIGDSANRVLSGIHKDPNGNANSNPSITVPYLPKVFIVVLNWNGTHDTIDCLNSLRNIDYSNFNVVVVDNGSSEPIPASVRMIHPEVDFAEIKANIGYAGGNNLGMRLAIQQNADYVLLLSNDTVVDCRFLSAMIAEALKDETIGIIGPTVYSHGDPCRIQSAGVTINWFQGSGRLLRWNEVDCTPPSTTKSVDYVSGCCLLAKISMIERIGLLNEKYFCYWEEVEWCARALESGQRVVCVNQAKIWHKGGHRTTGISEWREYYMSRNRVFFMRSHSKPLQFSIFFMYFLFADLWFKSAVLLLYYRNQMGFKGFLRGVIDGFRTNHTSFR